PWQLKEPDNSRVVKNLVKPSKPCGKELLALIDCTRRNFSGDADGTCMRERAALARCSSQRKKTSKGEILNHLKNLAASWKRFGF
uniref:mS37 n=1 Tax=Polytomella magna TaxID=353565 RepID=UPI002240E3BD|nr:Chain BB, mS37 [Polytomella magna]8APN_BB Chain BB, mS37 [Polytomella magna]8APO_BB Chain BB, mS37 [Polytomella magna]